MEEAVRRKLFSQQRHTVHSGQLSELLPCRLAYERNDDDEEEAARERRRRARQERLRQKEEDDLPGQVIEKPEVNAQNNITEEETKSTTTTITTVTNTQGDGDDDAVFLERMARREERRQKRLQEAMERQKEFDPTVTDESLSFASRKVVNNVEDNEAPGEEQTHRRRYEVEETETVTKSYLRNSLRQEEEDEKKAEEDNEEAQEEMPKPRAIEDNQVEVTLEEKTLGTDEEVVGSGAKHPEVNAEEQTVENDTSALAVEDQIGSEEAINITVALDRKKSEEEEEEEEEEEAERKRLEEKERLEREEKERLEREEKERLEREEKERLEREKLERAQAEEQRRAEEERERLEAEKRAAEEKERLEAEEKERTKAEEERKRIEAEEKKAAQERERREAEERERIKAEEKKAAQERERAKEKERREAEEREKAEAKKAAEEKAKLEEERLKAKRKAEEKKVDDKNKKGEEKKMEDKQVKEKKAQVEKAPATSLRKQIKDSKVNKAPKEEVKAPWDRKKGVPDSKPQNGEAPIHKLKHTENTFSRSGLKATPDGEAAKSVSHVEAGKRVEELRRRRGENESEEFEKLKQKQQEATVELEELKKKREERRKILEEEEQRRKKEEAERKIREEEEKRRLKEEIERRRAEAAEKRQKMPEDAQIDEKKPFKCFTPKGSSLKIEERAEFLNKSAQKSGMKPTHTTPVVSKIDSRLEQYTSAIEGNKATKTAKPAASDLPVHAEGVRNIKSMWERGNVFSSPSGPGTPNKETAGLKVGVSSRINEWLTKTPENNKSPAPKPSVAGQDLKPGDVSGKRNLWEKQSVEKTASTTKVTATGKKSETNGLRQFDKEP
ncbi:hypothetical protein lerEdw1_018232 [Lerista edwardsae]|nr:hypothetical protein lerEdw1_018232 [Lerista edwardsae]